MLEPVAGVFTGREADESAEVGGINKDVEPLEMFVPRGDEAGRGVLGASRLLDFEGLLL